MLGRCTAHSNWRCNSLTFWPIHYSFCHLTQTVGRHVVHLHICSHKFWMAIISAFHHLVPCNACIYKCVAFNSLLLYAGLSAHQNSCGTVSQKILTIQIGLKNPALIQLTSLNVQNFVKINYYYAINKVKVFSILMSDKRE